MVSVGEKKIPSLGSSIGLVSVLLKSYLCPTDKLAPLPLKKLLSNLILFDQFTNYIHSNNIPNITIGIVGKYTSMIDALIIPFWQ